MVPALKWFVGPALVVATGTGAGLYLAFVGVGPHPGYVTPALVPLNSKASQAAAASNNLPAAVMLPVPFTTQAPLGNWAERQHTCEEASLLMVDLYLHGDRTTGTLDPGAADRQIARITAWKPAVDLTVEQVGEVAHTDMGWAYEVIPATPLQMKEQLALGRPLIVGVRTHGLGNPNYPGYLDHHEEPGWSVSHYLVVVGYDAGDTFVLNDPGITTGHGYHIKYDQLMHAIDDLDSAYPNLDGGRVFLVLAPAAPVS